MTRNNNVFSMIIIPDTQELSTYYPDKLKEMTTWIVDNAEDLNLKKILHVGDVVNNGATREEQYLNHQEAYSLIDVANIPNLIAIGNHDYDNLLHENRDSAMFNKYCGIHKYESKDWFGDSYEHNKAENMYTKLSINGIKFLFLSLEYGTRDEVLVWADKVIEQHSDHKVIVVTHSYMYFNGERTKPGDDHNPKVYNGSRDANDGEDVWNKCLKKHKNVFAVFSGHHIAENISTRVECGENGNTVYQFFQNWQCAPNGGEGRIRILQFNVVDKKFDISVFNPQTEQFELEEGYNRSFKLSDF